MRPAFPVRLNGPTRAAFAIAVLTAAVAPVAAGGEPSTPPRLYDVTTRTSMPHLDENLRYATRTERRCVDTGDLSREFWMLREVSLQDCRLVKVEQTADSAGYRLQCDGGHGTSGRATWQLAPDAITGTLDVRLGGKNMTFYQRITARAVGAC